MAHNKEKLSKQVLPASLAFAAGVATYFAIKSHARGEQNKMLFEQKLDDRRASEEDQVMIGVLRESHKELSKKVMHDRLTGLFNEEALEATFKRLIGVRTSTKHSLLAIDLDKFKEVNDDHGHDAGDKVLQGVAKVLKDRSRELDIPARLHGDEFAILLPGANKENALLVADELGGLIHDAVDVTASFGVTEIDPTLPFAANLKYADLALYDAKRANNGPDNVR